MSPIGRVFIVLNLILAGAFVGFAGTFLQRHTDWKATSDGFETELAAAEQKATADLQAKDDELRKLDRELRAHKQQLDGADTDNKSLRDENQRLMAQLTELSGDVKNLSSQTTTMASEIQQSREQSRQAYTMAMEASQARDQANDAKEAAETTLADANRKIGDLESAIANANGRIAELTQSNEEKDVLLAMVQRNAPGVLASMQPDLSGVVHNVGPAGELVTVRINNNPGSVEVKPGYSLAIYKDGYKGEALIQSVEGEFAFCKMTRKVAGASISIGDGASTNLSGQ